MESGTMMNYRGSGRVNPYVKPEEGNTLLNHRVLAPETKEDTNTSEYDKLLAQQAAEDAKKAAEVAALRADILAQGGNIDSIYNALFGDLSTLVQSRAGELETQYGDQLKKASDQYAGALPEIETSYAAIGAADSTDQSDSKDKAKSGFDETTKTIGRNKEADQAKLGQYEKSERAKFEQDREMAKRNLARVNETDDIGALRGFRSDLENNIATAKVKRGELGTDEGARGRLSEITKDGGRYEAAVNALDSVLKSSMSGAVKSAAVEAITTSAGLSDEEKNKVQQQYGNVYAEQAAL